MPRRCSGVSYFFFISSIDICPTLVTRFFFAQCSCTQARPIVQKLFSKRECLVSEFCVGHVARLRRNTKPTNERIRDRKLSMCKPRNLLLLCSELSPSGKWSSCFSVWWLMAAGTARSEASWPSYLISTAVFYATQINRTGLKPEYAESFRIGGLLSVPPWRLLLNIRKRRGFGLCPPAAVPALAFSILVGIFPHVFIRQVWCIAPSRTLQRSSLHLIERKILHSWRSIGKGEPVSSGSRSSTFRSEIWTVLGRKARWRSQEIAKPCRWIRWTAICARYRPGFGLNIFVTCRRSPERVCLADDTVRRL